MKYKRVIVAGPEGSGTNILTDVVSELIGWPRCDPSALQIQKLQALDEERVHHISLPSHRPPVWARVGDLSDETVLVGIVRDEANSVYSAWRRFKGFPVTPQGGLPDFRVFMDNYTIATTITMHQALLTVGYEGLCAQPDYHVRLICANLQLPRRSYKSLGVELQNQNGKWQNDSAFVRKWFRYVDNNSTPRRAEKSWEGPRC